MTKIKFIVLLILFLPCISFGMEEQRENTKKTSVNKAIKYKGSKKLAPLAKMKDCPPKNSLKRSTLHYFSKEENTRLRKLIKSLPKTNNDEYYCSICDTSFKKIRHHILIQHLNTSFCGNCHQQLFIACPGELLRYPECSNGKSHVARKRGENDIISEMQVLQNKLLSSQASVHNH